MSVIDGVWDVRFGQDFGDVSVSVSVDLARVFLKVVMSRTEFTYDGYPTTYRSLPMESIPMPSRGNAPYLRYHRNEISNQVLPCTNNFIPLSGDGRHVLPPSVLLQGFQDITTTQSYYNHPRSFQHDFVPPQLNCRQVRPNIEPIPNTIGVSTNQNLQASAFQSVPFNYGTNCRQVRPNIDPIPNTNSVSTNQNPQVSAFQSVPFNYKIDPVSEVSFNRPDVSYRTANSSASSNCCPPLVSIPRLQQIEPCKSYEIPSQEVKIGALTKSRRRAKRSRGSRKDYTSSISHCQLSLTAGKDGHNEKLEPIFPIDLNRLLKSQSPDNSTVTPAVSSSNTNQAIELLDNELEAAAIDYENYDLVESIVLNEKSIESVLST
nr:hypothetical protein HmN_000994200 [Hymenolepis microstoma]